MERTSSSIASKSMATASSHVTKLHRACSKCEEFLASIKSLGEGIKSGGDPSLDNSSRVLHLQNIESIIEESRIGCHLCSLILVELRLFDQEELLLDLHADKNHNHSLRARIDENELNSLSGDKHERFFFSILFPEGYSRQTYYPILGSVGCKLLEDVIEAPRPTLAGAATTGSEETLLIIQYWLKKCESEHPECLKRRRKIRQLPTRLLNITVSSGQSRIYLRESCYLPQDSSYMTLSYCWGSDRQQARLLTGNYDSLCLNGLSIDDLPQTFQDAAWVASNLGIDYFWIDSLCIVQDSPDDWARESLTMSDVYSGSFLNIAASCSTGSWEGFFRTRDPLAITPFQTMLSYSPAKWDRELVAIYPHIFGYSQLNDQPLSKRGWALQERLLPARTAHFLTQRVHWECQSFSAFETDPANTLGIKLSHDGSMTGWATLPKPRSDISDIEMSDGSCQLEWTCLRKWQEAVELYSKCRLSFSSDKLIAISGIARYLKHAMWRDDTVQYYAGLWSYRFDLQLLWYVISVGDYAGGYRAPSWSWAAFDGAIAWSSHEKHIPQSSVAEILNVSVGTPSNPFGHVHSGHVDIRGLLCTVRVIPPAAGFLDADLGSVKMELTPFGTRIGIDDLIFDDHSENGELVLLAVVEDFPPHSTLKGLVMRQAASQENGDYIRIGYFQTRNLYRPAPESEHDLEYGQEESAGSSERLSGPDDYSKLQNAFARKDLPQNLYKEMDPESGLCVIRLF